MKKFSSYIQEKKDAFLEEAENFVKFACEWLELDEPPAIYLSDNKKHAVAQKSFGGYSPSEKDIRVNIAERHKVDVFRTLAHELVHYRQDIDGRLDEDSGQTGSEIENEANAVAGIIMREYARATNGAIFEEYEVEIQEQELLAEGRKTNIDNDPRRGHERLKRYSHMTGDFGSEATSELFLKGEKGVKGYKYPGKRALEKKKEILDKIARMRKAAKETPEDWRLEGHRRYAHPLIKKTVEKQLGRKLEEASPMIAPPSNRFATKRKAFQEKERLEQQTGTPHGVFQHFYKDEPRGFSVRKKFAAKKLEEGAEAHCKNCGAHIGKAKEVGPKPYCDKCGHGGTRPFSVRVIPGKGGVPYTEYPGEKSKLRNKT